MSANVTQMLEIKARRREDKNGATKEQTRVKKKQQQQQQKQTKKRRRQQASERPCWCRQQLNRHASVVAFFGDFGEYSSSAVVFLSCISFPLSHCLEFVQLGNSKGKWLCRGLRCSAVLYSCFFRIMGAQESFS